MPPPRPLPFEQLKRFVHEGGQPFLIQHVQAFLGDGFVAAFLKNGPASVQDPRQAAFDHSTPVTHGGGQAPTARILHHRNVQAQSVGL